MASPKKPFTEIVVDGGALGGSSVWKSDPVALSTLKLGYRIGDIIAPYFLSRLGYGAVNERSILTLSLGVQAWGRIGPLRPYARASLLHQHEEPLPDLLDDVGGAFGGVGDGIRHRWGGELAFGAEVPIYQDKKNILIIASAEAVADYMPDPRGPRAYVLGGLGIGLRYGTF